MLFLAGFLDFTDFYCSIKGVGSKGGNAVLAKRMPVRSDENLPYVCFFRVGRLGHSPIVAAKLALPFCRASSAATV